jgi:hypothetical protein
VEKHDLLINAALLKRIDHDIHRQSVLSPWPVFLAEFNQSIIPHLFSRLLDHPLKPGSCIRNRHESTKRKERGNYSQ